MNTPVVYPDINLKFKAIKNTIWLAPADTAILVGVSKKTLIRAIQAKQVRYKVINNRYLIDVASAIEYMCTKIKLKNKLDNLGLGQLVKNWQK
jgi:hypothetical protein